MGEQAKLSDQLLITTLRAHYGISVSLLTYLPIGADSESAVYRVQATDGVPYFLKLRTRGGFSLKSLSIPRFLLDRGLPHILAPLSTLSGALMVDLEGYVLSLYPFIEGRTAVEAGLPERDWREFGAILKQVHESPLPPDLRPIVPSESYVPSRRGLITELERLLAAGSFGDPIQRELAAFWLPKKDEIDWVVNRSDALAEQLRQASLPLVLCHADLHTWNLLVDSFGGFWVIDWDETVLAPKERDLMFVIGGIGANLVKPSETGCFLKGYGDPAVDALALAYYRYAWAVQDMAAYAEVAFLRNELSAETRRAALDGFKSLFEPGQIVSIALAGRSMKPSK
jgi:spectinomycin phosphotransferase